MSKRTKKQKILAELRRKKQNSRSFIAQNISNSLPNFTREEEEKDAPPSKKEPNQNQSIYYYPIHLIRKDLTKTLFLCILAISFEIALFLILK